MQYIKIYKLGESNQYLVNSERTDRPTYLKSYLMNLEAGKERISIVFPFNKDRIREYLETGGYNEVPNYDSQYKELKAKSRSILEKRWVDFYTRVMEDKKSGDISEMEAESKLDNFRRIYVDLLTD